MEEFQTRSEENGFGRFSTLSEAFKAAEKDKTIWKISTKEVRLVRFEFSGKTYWEYDPIERVIEEAKAKSKNNQ